MRIMPVANTSTYRINSSRENKLNFSAHPDFYNFNSIQSCFFRRGAVLLSCSKGYSYIEDIFLKIFKPNTDIQRSMLIIGIGRSQEPFSYMASIKGIIQNRKLNKNVDLYTVDLQSKPEYNELKKNSFCDLFDYEKFPKYAEDGFIKDTGFSHPEKKKTDYVLNPIEEYLLMLNKKNKEKTSHYRVNDEIFDFVNSTYNNPEKSKWESPVQEVITEYPNEKFDIVSANNVLPYIVSVDDIIRTIKHIKRTLKPNGYFITDPYEYPQQFKDAGVLDNMKQVYAGIYQKIQ